jgi:uncharacterized protein (DUF488 family)
MKGVVFTIGHSNHPIENFIDLLKEHGVTALADVRSHPYSKRHPQYSKKNLKNFLGDADILYVFLGKELGARSENTDCYLHGKADYGLLAGEPAFLSGIGRLYKGMEDYTLALMCSEGDPLDCHRAVLVARRLHENGITVRHIHPGGDTETHAELESRMLKSLKISETDMFLSRKEILRYAYEQHGGRIAYEDDVKAREEDRESWLL